MLFVHWIYAAVVADKPTYDEEHELVSRVVFTEHTVRRVTTFGDYIEITRKIRIHRRGPFVTDERIETICLPNPFPLVHRHGPYYRLVVCYVSDGGTLKIWRLKTRDCQYHESERRVPFIPAEK